MNRDQITGAVKVAAGMAQKKLGDIIGNSRHQACGLSRGFEGRAQMLVGECRALVLSITRRA